MLAVAAAGLALGCISAPPPSGPAASPSDGEASPAPPTGISAAPSAPVDASPAVSSEAPAPAGPSAPPQAPTGHLAEAIDHAPADADEIDFTDWSAIKASLGAEDVTGASPEDDRSVS